MKEAKLIFFAFIYTSSIFSQFLVSEFEGTIQIKNENPSGIPFRSMLVETFAGTSTADQIVGIDSRIESGSNWALGIQGVATTTNPSSNGRAFGVRGLASNATPGANFGLWGEVLGSNNGAAILGWDRIKNPNWSQLISDDQSWAGYFFGDVHVTDKLGLGTENPGAKLQITQGDVYIETIGCGVIMKSPDGQCWRFVPDNSGAITSQPISCPN